LRRSEARAPVRISFAALGFAIFVIAWAIGTRGNKTSDLPTPYQSVVALFELAESGALWRHIIASVFRVGWGFGLGMAFGIPLGIALGRIPFVQWTVNPVVQALRPISAIAWLPIFTILTGSITWWEPSDVAAIGIIFLLTFLYICTATTIAVGSIERKYLRSAANFGIRGLQLIRRVIVPAALPQIVTALRLALGIAWIIIVAAEMLGVQSGLGYAINDSRNALRFDRLVATIIVIAVIGLLLDFVFARLEQAALARRGVTGR
jgi:NitT/TauT family transport system permease protein